MVRSVILMAYFFLAASVLFAEAVLAADEVPNIHQAATQCQEEPCTTLECQVECDQVCLTCHEVPYLPDLSGFSAWNPSGKLIYKVYAAESPLNQDLLKDKCMDCHQGHYEAEFNHPVEIAYAPQDSELTLRDDPEGPYLICDPGGRCSMSCISCHKLHPSESLGEQIASRLRVSQSESALCLSCHAM